MKKFIVAILALLYISTTTGATIHMHYCMGELVEWALVNDADNTCDNCGMEKAAYDNNGCCKDESKQVKIDDDQKAAYSFLKPFKFHDPVLHVYPAYQTDPLLPLKSRTTAYSHAPPFYSGVSLTIRYCNFLI